jgi:predicted RNA-binding Zn ribbon-like protein
MVRKSGRGRRSVEAMPWEGGPAPAYDFSGGRPALDFANTVGGRGRETPRDDLPSYAHLVAWGRQAGLIADSEAEALVRSARTNPDGAISVHTRAVELREAIYRVMAALPAGMPPMGDDLATVNAELANALAHARVIRTDGEFVWGWNASHRLDRVLWPVARDAAELLTSELRERVRVCAEQRCGWLFMDASKNRSRQWCDMKVCGNRAKARRHYERTRAARR